MNINEKKSFDVIVIGGGAAGMMAAITAASNGADTMILEHKDRVGKKILSTGNGKCNYTNELQGVTYYRGDDHAFVLPVMEQFGFEETVSFFEKLGIYPKNRNGYYYPASEQAASVLDVLRMELTFRHVAVVTECELRNISGKKNGFLLETDKGRFSAEKIIFATGLLAAPKTGSDGSAIPLIKAFGHRFSDIVPALTALQCRESFFRQLAGIRTEAEVSLFIAGENIISERGELQLTDYGISGIPVFQVSRFATKALKKKQAVTAQIDFLPRLNEQEIEQLFGSRFREYAHGKTADEAMVGLLNNKLTKFVFGLYRNLIGEISIGKFRSTLCNSIKWFPYIKTVKEKQYSSHQIGDDKQKLNDPEKAAAALVQITHEIVNCHISPGVQMFCNRCNGT